KSLANRRGAAEVRKQVSSAYLADLPKSISGLNLATQNVPLCDVVEPPDYEDFLHAQQTALERDPMRHLLEFPPDDVQLEVLQRKVRTIAPVVPEHGCVCFLCADILLNILNPGLNLIPM
ncbi:hypothetical protein CAPTEDRAFT_133102, partial [Capitella teleta]